MTDKPIVEVVGLSMSIGTREILKDISFEVPEGRYLSIAGPNGAGKTTLLKCIDRIITGWTGTIAVAGKDLGEYSQKDLAGLMSYVPQADGRLFPFTVYEFVLMGRYPYLSPFSSVGREDRAAAERALEITGTVRFSNRDIRTLSGGERQKVFIAAALAQEAKVLLLDEPTTFLDPAHADEVRDILARLNLESGVTILSVTHDINSAALAGGMVLALKEGSAAFLGAAEDFMHNRVLKRVFGKEFTFVGHPATGRAMVVPGVPGT